MKPERVVVDASAAVPLVLAQPSSPVVDRFLRSATGHVQLVAPEFWLLECGNAIWVQVRRKQLDARQALSCMDGLRQLGVSLLDSAHLIDAAFTIALGSNITTYDALYVATTQYVDGTLVTADEKLLESLRRASWPVRAVHVRDWAFP